jgi:hypothetical protein
MSLRSGLFIGVRGLPMRWVSIFVSVTRSPGRALPGTRGIDPMLNCRRHAVSSRRFPGTRYACTPISTGTARDEPIVRSDAYLTTACGIRPGSLLGRRGEYASEFQTASTADFAGGCYGTARSTRRSQQEAVGAGNFLGSNWFQKQFRLWTEDRLVPLAGRQTRGGKDGQYYLSGRPYRGCHGNSLILWSPLT